MSRVFIRRHAVQEITPLGGKHIPKEFVVPHPKSHHLTLAYHHQLDVPMKELVDLEVNAPESTQDSLWAVAKKLVLCGHKHAICSLALQLEDNEILKKESEYYNKALKQTDPRASNYNFEPHVTVYTNVQYEHQAIESLKLIVNERLPQKIELTPPRVSVYYDNKTTSSVEQPHPSLLTPAK